MRKSVSFTNCPECGVPVGSQGLPNHRKAHHGVTPERTTPKRAKRLSLAERLAKLAQAREDM